MRCARDLFTMEVARDMAGIMVVVGFEYGSYDDSNASHPREEESWPLLG